MRKIGPDTPIDNIGFSFRTRNSLRRAHIDTFKDLMDAYEKGEIRRIKSLGKVQYGEILAIIDSLGYRKENKVISNPYIHSRGYHVPREIENIPIDNMNLENRLRNPLYREGYRTVGKIMRMKKESLYLIHGIGDKSIDELMKVVKVNSVWYCYAGWVHDYCLQSGTLPMHEYDPADVTGAVSVQIPATVDNGYYYTSMKVYYQRLITYSKTAAEFRADE